MGESLHDVDFQQLKIENAQFLETIKARNQELIQLKLVSRNTLQILNAYKVRSALVLGASCAYLSSHREVLGHHCGFTESLGVLHFPVAL